jgi:hypothetical protein
MMSSQLYVPAAKTLEKNPRQASGRKLSGPQGQFCHCGQEEAFLFCLELNSYSSVVQPQPSRYSDWAILASNMLLQF